MPTLHFGSELYLPLSQICFNFVGKEEYKMDKQKIFDRIEYVVACVGAFAERYGLSNQQAYAYLERFAGIDFLIDCYEAEHTLSIDDAVVDLQHICLRQGGRVG